MQLLWIGNNIGNSQKFESTELDAQINFHAFLNLAGNNKKRIDLGKKGKRARTWEAGKSEPGRPRSDGLPMAWLGETVSHHPI
jgi:hypothetical protein